MNEYEKREAEMELELVWLEKNLPVESDDDYGCELYENRRREVSDLKHEIWQSRL